MILFYLVSIQHQFILLRNYSQLWYKVNKVQLIKYITRNLPYFQRNCQQAQRIRFLTFQMDHSFVVVDVFVVEAEAGAVDRKFVAVGRGWLVVGILLPISPPHLLLRVLVILRSILLLSKSLLRIIMGFIVYVSRCFFFLVLLLFKF